MRRFLPFFTLMLLPGFSLGQTPKLPSGVTASVTVEGVSEYKLANGLRVLLIPDASQPKVTVNCTIFVGSRHEGYGETGMAHLLEHMVFKGCPKFLNVPKALADHGANFNGTTWLDRTNYFETMTATDENLEFGIELEADRLMNSFIRREDLMSEFTVVRNEFESGENSPERVLSQRMAAVAFEWHNYGKSTIGNKTDIERVPIDNLQAFYKKYYRPDNAMLVVAGKFDSTKALDLIAKHFGPLKNPSTPVPATYTEEPAQDGERLVALRRVGTVGATGAVYHVPAGAHPDYPACEVLEGVLTTAPAGRLYKALVESKIATRIGGDINATHDPGIIELIASTDAVKTEQARTVLIETLENLAKQPVTEEEVERIKRQLLLSRERLLSNSQGLAINLSEWAAAGDWRLFFLHRDRLEKVTAKDVNAAAAKYLVRSNRTVGVYYPTKTPERAEVPVAPKIASLVEGYKGRTAVAAGEAFDPSPTNIEERVKRGQFEGGVKYALLPKKTRGETVNLTLTLRFGDQESLKPYVVASGYLGGLMQRGTTTRTRQQIKDELEKLNASIGVPMGGIQLVGGLGQLNYTIQTKRNNLPAVLEILTDILRNPSFPAEEFEKMKKEKIEAVEAGLTEPQMLAITSLRRKTTPYPKGDLRYVPTMEEEIARNKAGTVDDVKKLYETHMGASHGELAVVGDFDATAVTEVLTKAFAGWKSKSPYKRISNQTFDVAGSNETINTPDKANAIYVASLTMPIRDTDPDYAALSIGNYLLGEAPLASRLSNRVRGKDGLSYGTQSVAVASPVESFGQFLIFAITNPKNLGKVDAAIREEVDKFLAEGVSASELEEAKKAVIASMKERRANDGGLASSLAGALYAERTFQYQTELEERIEKLQPADIQKAFRKLIDPKKLTIIQAGDVGKK
jgi:zinc protease